jgi:hypothetical protein
MRETTTIAGKVVPLKPGARSTVVFTAGRAGPAEAGIWELWAAVDDQGKGQTARCQQGDDPGERFRRMETAPGYEAAWELAKTATLLRPATLREVASWLASHEEDTKFATACSVDGKSYAIEQQAGFRLVEKR